MKTRIIQTMVSGGVMAMIGLLGGARDAHGLACGDTIGPNAGLVTMTADLSCGAVPYGLKVVGPKTILDMKGHDVSCGPTTYPAIQVTGTGAVVKNGSVSNCGTGIEVPTAGLGAHTISNIYAFGHLLDGFTIVADGNKLISNTSDFNANSWFQ